MGFGDLASHTLFYRTSFAGAFNHSPSRTKCAPHCAPAACRDDQGTGQFSVPQQRSFSGGQVSRSTLQDAISGAVSCGLADAYVAPATSGAFDTEVARTFSSGEREHSQCSELRAGYHSRDHRALQCARRLCFCIADVQVPGRNRAHPDYRVGQSDSGIRRLPR